jgi:hypothetical protein
MNLRRTGLGFVPYIDMPIIGRAGVFTNRLPLWEFVQGPTAHSELAAESLRLLGTLSRIPLRG